MKKILFLSSVLVAFLASGCTRVIYVSAPAGATTEQKKAAEKSARLEAQQERLKQRLNLDCPDGGRKNVMIGGDLVGNAFRVSGNGVARFLLARYMGLVEVTNPYNETVHISEGGRPVVRDMCPHGTVTLPAVLGWDAGIMGGRNSYSGEELVWTATRFVNGHLYYGVSQYMSLYVYQWQKEKKVQWVMRVDDIDSPLPEHLGRR